MYDWIKNVYILLCVYIRSANYTMCSTSALPSLFLNPSITSGTLSNKPLYGLCPSSAVSNSERRRSRPLTSLASKDGCRLCLLTYIGLGAEVSQPEDVTSSRRAEKDICLVGLVLGEMPGGGRVGESSSSASVLCLVDGADKLGREPPLCHESKDGIRCGTSGQFELSVSCSTALSLRLSSLSFGGSLMV